MNNSLLKMAKEPVWPTVFPLPVDILGTYMQVLNEQGYSLLEILARPLEQALEVFQQVNSLPERKKMAIGFGTILTEKAAIKALKLKPDFLVSPAFSRRVLDCAADSGVPYIPGVSTYQDIQNVLEAFEEKNLELKILKICSVTKWMDHSYIESLSGCYPGIVFCLTSVRNVTLEELFEYRKIPSVGAVMGTCSVSQELLERKNPEELQKRIKEIKQIFKERTMSA